MLARRVIPCLDVANGRVVKGTKFVNLTDEGDPAELVAASERVRRQLGWQPRHDDLEFILKTAWAWEQKLAAPGS